jgi:hypothetical protein
VVPPVLPEKLTKVVATPLHTVWLNMGFTEGTGFTWKVMEVLFVLVTEGQGALLTIETVI